MTCAFVASFKECPSTDKKLKSIEAEHTPAFCWCEFICYVLKRKHTHTFICYVLKRKNKTRAHTHTQKKTKKRKTKKNPQARYEWCTFSEGELPFHHFRNIYVCLSIQFKRCGNWSWANKRKCLICKCTRVLAVESQRKMDLMDGPLPG